MVQFFPEARTHAILYAPGRARTFDLLKRRVRVRSQFKGQLAACVLRTHSIMLQFERWSLNGEGQPAQAKSIVVSSGQVQEAQKDRYRVREWRNAWPAA